MEKPVSLITGGAGFIGSHLVDMLLQKGHEVRVIDDFSTGRESNLTQHKSNSDFKFEKISILDINLDHPFFSGLDYCFHLAGMANTMSSIESPLEYMNVNVIGTSRILEGCRNSELKNFLYAGSSSCYGIASTPTLESDCIDPQHPYALSKYLAEEAVVHWGNLYDFPINSLRIFNVYGPRASKDCAYGAVFGIFLKQKLEGTPLTIIGDGEQKRDFIYVTDVANAFYIVSTEGEDGEIYNIGSGAPQSINRLATLLKCKFTTIPKRPGEPDRMWSDISKIQYATTWSPKIPFEKGVEFTVDSINDWKDAPLWTEESIKENSKTWFKYLS